MLNADAENNEFTDFLGDFFFLLFDLAFFPKYLALYFSMDIFPIARLHGPQMGRRFETLSVPPLARALLCPISK